MAKMRFILAVYLALILVVVPSTVVLAEGPNQAPIGGGSDGHPWDDGTTQQPPPDSSGTALPQVTLPPPTTVTALSSGSVKWIGGAIFSLWQSVKWQSVKHIKVSSATSHARRL